MTELQIKKLNIENEYLLRRKAKAESLPTETFHLWKNEYENICQRLGEIEKAFEQAERDKELEIERRVKLMREKCYNLLKGTTAAAIENYLDANPAMREKTKTAIEKLVKYLDSGGADRFEVELDDYIHLWRKVIHDADTPVQQRLAYGEAVSNDGCPWKSTA